MTKEEMSEDKEQQAINEATELESLKQRVFVTNTIISLMMKNQGVDIFRATREELRSVEGTAFAITVEPNGDFEVERLTKDEALKLIAREKAKENKN